jgi:hypothetical protein
MTEEEEIILKIVGEVQLKDLNAELVKHKQALTDATVALREGTLSEAAYEAQVTAALPRMVELNREIGQMNVQAKSFSGQGGLQLGYIMDDLVNTTGGFERKIAAINNNIPGFLMSLGLGPGVAGQAALITAGFTAALPVLRKFFDSLFADSPEARKHLEDLKKAAEDAADAFNRMAEKSTAAEEAGQKALATGLEHPYGREVQDALVKSMEATKSGEGVKYGETPEDLPWTVKAAQFMGPANETAARIANQALIDQNIQERVRRQQLQAAQAILGRAAAGKTRAEREQGMLEIQGHVQVNPGMFPPAFVQDLPHMTTEGVAADEKEADDWLEKTQGWSEQAKRRRDAAAAEKKTKAQVDRLNVAGQRAQRDAATQLERDNKADELKAANARKRAEAQAKRDFRPNQIRQAAMAFADTGANEAQMMEMGRSSLRYMEQGVDAMSANQFAYQDMQAKMARLNERMQQIQAGFMNANNRQLGGDHFSFLSPLPGG